MASACIPGPGLRLPVPEKTFLISATAVAAFGTTCAPPQDPLDAHWVRR